MDPRAMKPYGMALLDYHRGDTSATVTVLRDDGLETALPMSVFFRQAQDLPPDRMALDLCHGRVLDAGAGAGCHSLFLQGEGFPVCAIDVSPEAVRIMRERGVADARESDIMLLEEGRFDTILMLGRGIGMVEDIPGLDRFLSRAHKLLQPGGQVLVDSLDVRVTDDPLQLAYHKKNLDAGRYFGEVRMQFSYGGDRGPTCGWLHVDPESLRAHASGAGWVCEIVHQQEDGNYLARLTSEENS